MRLGRACVGIEVNPVAVLVARAKTISRSANHIRKLVDRVRLGANQSAKRAVIPASVQAAKWYTERTIRELRRLRHYLDTLSGEARVIADTAFSAILLPVCRETRHWGYVCDNTNPKGTYERDVYETFERTLASFVEAYAERQAYWQAASGQPVVAPNVKIHEGDARNILLDMPPESAHLIVTSPPYFGVADYVKAQRLTLEWFGKDIEPLRLEEIGARSKRHRITAADDYLSECKQVFEGCRHVLKKDRACVVIFGESNERKPMHSMFVSIMEECGFQLRYSAPRKISARRRLTPQLQVEYLLVFT